MDAVLTASEVRKSFDSPAGAVEALRGVSLSVARGEFVAVMGASGSGKSTLLHLLGGLDRPTSGRILIEGRDLATLSDRARTLFRRRRLGIVFQSYNLLPTLSAIENVALPRILDQAGGSDLDDRAEALLRRVGLGDRLEHRPQALSGGEQQRVAIARALMMRPAVLLADEPTGNLDSDRGAEIWRLLASLSSEESATVLAVTHESSGASHADRVIILKDGRVAGEIRPRGADHAAVVANRYAELVG